MRAAFKESVPVLGRPAQITCENSDQCVLVDYFAKDNLLPEVLVICSMSLAAGFSPGCCPAGEESPLYSGEKN